MSEDFKHSLEFIHFEDELATMPPSCNNQCNIPWVHAIQGFSAHNFDPKWLEDRLTLATVERILTELNKSEHIRIPISKLPFYSVCLSLGSFTLLIMTLIIKQKISTDLFYAVLCILSILFFIMISLAFWSMKQLGAKRRNRIYNLRQTIYTVAGKLQLHDEIKTELSPFGSYIIIKVSKEIHLTCGSIGLEELGNLDPFDCEELSPELSTCGPYRIHQIHPLSGTRLEKIDVCKHLFVRQPSITDDPERGFLNQKSKADSAESGSTGSTDSPHLMSRLPNSP